MSGVGASTAVNSGPSALGNADGLLALAAFVQKPEYAARVKELQAAEAAATEAQKVAKATLDRVVADDTALQAAKIDFKRQLSDFLASKEQAVSKLSARENAVTARELAVTERERVFNSKAASVTADLGELGRSYELRNRLLDEREKALAASQLQLDVVKADYARRLAKIREASQ